MAERSQAEESPALEARALSRRFGALWALCEVSFTLRAGEALLISGHNGSGKSTLLRLLAGSLRPDRGEVRVQGLADRASLRGATALFAHACFAYEPLSALENLELFARLAGRDARRASLLARLEEVGLADRADSLVQGFSEGMQRRLALARLLLQEPRVALFDEPHSALDAAGARQLDEVVLALKRRGAAVVLATHAVARAAPLCEQGIVLERGRIQWAGPARALAASGTALAAAEEVL